MSRWMCAAQVNKKLIFVLVLLALIAGGIWTCRFMGGDEDTPKVSADQKFELWCPGRDEPFMLTKAEADELKFENNLYENPETGVCECSWTRKIEAGGGMIRP